MNNAIFIIIFVGFVIIRASTPSVQQNFVLVKGGKFAMGSNTHETQEKPIHQVSVKSFYICRYEVTFDEFDDFCTKTGRPKVSYAKSAINDKARGKRPIIYISWYDAVEYCNWRSKKEGLTLAYIIHKTKKDPNNNCEYDMLKWHVTCNFKANGYRLPTEAEWEYAAKGGIMSKGNTYSGTNNADSLDFYAWFRLNARGRPHAVNEMGRIPNELGLYNMSGNVSEWCWDWYSATYAKSSQKNPIGPRQGTKRVKRSGSWSSPYKDMRITRRGFGFPNMRVDNGGGFRLVRTY
jgi:sulfatase modifying factor 1